MIAKPSEKNVLTTAPVETILWISPQSQTPRFSDTERFRFQFADSATWIAQDKIDPCNILVADFKELSDSIVSRIRRQNCPVLFLANPMSLSRTLELLEDDDDVCLVDSPQELILARLESIARRYEMNFDTLSRVLRKACWLQKLEKAGVAVNHDSPLTVLALDIDNFKQLNDQYGHAKGDEVIVAIGRELCRAFPNGIVGRHGGDEFGVISWQSEAVVMQQAAEFQRRLESENKMLRGVTVSLGIAQTRVATSARDIIYKANQALYAAKAEGRNRVVSFADVLEVSASTGDDVEVVNLENTALVLSQRVTNFITHRSKRIMRKLRHEADTDGLTRIFTRRYLDQNLNRQIELARKESSTLSVALIDIDHFGAVNKTHGWPSGDKILVEICSALSNEIEESWWIGRYGGEEFCLVMPAVPLVDAVSRCEKVRQLVESSAFETTSGDPLNITLSMRGVELDRDDSNAADIFERVSQLTLKAKDSGRNKLVSS